MTDLTPDLTPEVVTSSEVVPSRSVCEELPGQAVLRTQKPTIGERIPLALEPGLRFHDVHAEALAAEIAVMLDRLVSDRHTFVIFEVGTGRNHFVQFISEGGTRLLGEAVGERHAPDLDARQQLQLMRLGWRLPEEEPNCAGNYWRKWEPPDLLDAASSPRSRWSRSTDSIVRIESACGPPGRRTGPTIELLDGTPPHGMRNVAMLPGVFASFSSNVSNGASRSSANARYAAS